MKSSIYAREGEDEITVACETGFVSWGVIAATGLIKMSVNRATLCQSWHVLLICSRWSCSLKLILFPPFFFRGPRAQMHISVWFQIIWGSWVGFPCEDKVPFKSQRYKKFNLLKNQFHILKHRPSIQIPIPTGATFITSHQSVTEGGGLFASRRLHRNLSYDTCQHEIWFGGPDKPTLRAC